MESINDINSFNSLYNESYKSFLKFTYGYVKDLSISEDFVSEAFMLYWEKRNELLEDTVPKAYILTILKNKCLNHLKHMQVKQRVKSELTEHADWVLNISINSMEACDPDFIFSKEIQEIIDSTINRLPEKTKLAFLLSRNHNLTNKEIANHMLLSVKSVEYHISKALSQLRVSLKDFMCVLPFLYFIC